MRAYLMTTGVLFALLAAMHVWRGAIEPNVVHDPWFVLLSVVALAMSVWAFSLLRRTPRALSDDRS